MSDVLYQVVKEFDHDVHMPYSHHNVANEWPKGELERMLKAGLLRQIESTDRVECMQCWNLEDVVFLDNPTTGATTVYVKCFQCGSNRVPEEWIHQWQSDCRELIQILNSKIGVSGPTRELVEKRIWGVGRARIGNANRNIYFGRALFEPDTWRIFNQAKMSTRSVLLVPEFVPEFDVRYESIPIVIPIAPAFSWQDGQLQLDLEFIEAEVAAHAPAESNANPKRSTRLDLIERLTGELSDHLIAARDYAFTQQDRGGEPKLLPRPTREFLAQKLGVNKSSVTRAFKDPNARELNYLWELASDVYRIMDFAGSRTKSCTK